MWRPGKNIPQELVDVFMDEESEESGGEEPFAMEEEVYDDEEEVFDITGMPMLLEGNNGEFHSMPVAVEAPLGTSVVETGFSSDEDYALRQVVLDNISPLTSRALSPVVDPNFHVAHVELHEAGPSTSGAAASVRGRSRGCGRGCKRGRGLQRPGWSRGHPLEERYETDEDVPEDIRLAMNRVMRARVNARISHASEREHVEGFDADEEIVCRGMAEFANEREPFLGQPAGPTRLIDNAYDAVHSFWTDDIMGHIVDETNRYAQEIVAKRARFARDWFATNVHELWTLFAFWLMLGIVKMPTIKSCFTRMPLLRTDVFRTLFTESRYWNLNAAFHLKEGRGANEALHPMGPIIEHLNDRFQAMYRLDQEICIDESLTLWKGPVRFRQYIKTKAAKYGIKTYQLCESASGYLYKFFVYTAAQPTQADDTASRLPMSLPSRVRFVLRLIWPLLNRGHTLFMDNWFNSPTLARWLKRHKTDCVGTLKACRKQVPFVVQKSPLAEGQFVARCSDDVMVIALQDRKRVTCLSTYHDVSQVVKEARPGHPLQHKLKLIDDYNRGMGGVDRLDQMLEPYHVERKQCLKWNKKLFKRLFNISIQNARIIVEKSTGTKLDALAFRLSLVQQIIDRHLAHVPKPPAQHQKRIHSHFPVGRLTERHFIRRIPVTDAMRQNVVHKTNLGRRNCVWCKTKKITKRTVYECTECDVPLCLDNCFREFHTTA